jgi:hypothetical protein
MRDLAAVDRQLSELAEGAAPDVRELLARILGIDRSLARLNELLEGLGVPPNGTSPRIASLAPAPAALRDPLAPAARASVRTPSDFTPALRGTTPAAFPAPTPSAPRSDPPPTRPNPPGVRGSLPPRIVSPLAPVQGDGLKTATPWPPVQASAPAPARARDTLVDAAVPPPAPAPAPAPAQAAVASAAAQPVASKVDEVELDAATAALFGVTMPPAGAQHALQDSVPMPAPLPPIAVEESEPSSETSRENRAAMRELLDREIDPNDFPSSHPPRAMRSVPPPLPKPQAEQADGFEMLIDDEGDDIMEIDDVELEEIE